MKKIVLLLSIATSILNAADPSAPALPAILYGQVRADNSAPIGEIIGALANLVVTDKG